MRRVLCLLIYVTIISITAQGQDFVSRYLQTCEGDTTLNYISVSPKMMEKALANDLSDNNADLQEILSHLKSMQVITSQRKTDKHYAKAEEILKRNMNRYKTYSSYEGIDEHCNVSVRERNGNIVELVMLRKQNSKFTAISFTGLLTDELIHKIAQAMKMSKSD